MRRHCSLAGIQLRPVTDMLRAHAGAVQAAHFCSHLGRKEGGWKCGSEELLIGSDYKNQVNCHTSLRNLMQDKVPEHNGVFSQDGLSLGRRSWAFLVCQPFPVPLPLDFDRELLQQLLGAGLCSLRAGLGRVLDVCMVWARTPLTMLDQRGLSLSLTKIYGVPGELRFAYKQLCHSPTHKETMTS